MPNSLHERWQKTVAAHPEAIALTDASSGEILTFSELEARARRTLPHPFPGGNSVEFIAQTIAAWRVNIAICPLEANCPEPEIADLPSGTAHIKTTSGSTGTPRLVLFDADQLAADAANIVATMQLTADRSNIGVISMAHSYGFSNLVLPLLLHGIPLIICSDPLPGSFSRALTFLPKTGGCVPAVPAMWRAWLNSGCLDVDRIRLAISAGAPLTSELENRIFDEAGIKVHNFYGSSECGGIAYDGTDAPRSSPQAVGTPMSGVTTSLSSEGCLIVHSSAVGTTYWPAPETDVLGGSRFVTNDLAKVAPDGSITLRGRAGDRINIAGRKLDPSTIEAELAKHPSVTQCLVFGIASPDPERVQEIVAITDGGEEVALRAHLAKRLPSWQRIRHWWVNPSLKPNSRGKLSRSLWREKWLAR
ncbi:MAG: long-chain acyl-CoA synthetase [Pseudoalteromonas tetraodonis]|jgi:long-chain acyl-CoA synthetase